MESLWTIINFVGPFLLLAVLVWAFLYNRRGRKSDIDRAERGARQLREDIDAEEARRNAP